MKSRELCRWACSWLRGKGHEFRPGNLGVPCVVCIKCNLLLTSRGRIQTPSHMWLAESAQKPRIGRVTYCGRRSGKAITPKMTIGSIRITHHRRQNDSSSSLRKMAMKISHSCKELRILEVMES